MKYSAMKRKGIPQHTHWDGYNFLKVVLMRCEEMADFIH